MFSHKLKFSYGMIAACLLAFMPAVGEAQKDLQKEIQKLKKRVAALEQAHEPLYLEVHCDNGDTVADAMTEAEGTTGPVTIVIYGVCQEQVFVNHDNVELIGASEGCGLQAPSAESNVLSLHDVRNVSLSRLTLTGGNGGLHAGSGTVFYATDLHVRDTGNAVWVDVNASGHLSNPTIEDNRSDGIWVGRGGVLSVSGGRIENNNGAGVVVREGSVVNLWDGILVQNNGGCGAHAYRGGSLSIYGATIQDNGYCGVAAWTGGSIRLSGSETLITENGVGLVLSDDASVEMSGGARVASNLGDGIQAGSGAAVTMLDGAIVNNNGGHGLALNGAVGSIIAGAIVEYNGGDGVRLMGGASATIDGSTIQWNTGNGVYLTDTSVAILGDYRAETGTNEILNNSAYGVLCEPEPAVAQISLPIGTVSGNTSGQVNCPRWLNP